MGNVKAVLFDLGWTLVDAQEPARIIWKILKANGVKIPLAKIRKTHADTPMNVDELARKGIAYWIEYNAKLLEKMSVEGNLDFLARQIDSCWWDNAELEVYPEVVETLLELRGRGLKLGVVTNGFEKDFHQIADRVGLTDCFDVAVGADSCNRAKPDCTIFNHALIKLKTGAKETIFVGDSLRYDFEGARQAGLKALLICRKGECPPEAECIHSLKEVLDYV